MSGGLPQAVGAGGWGWTHPSVVGQAHPPPLGARTMAYDNELGSRVRALLSSALPIEEKHMFGGLAWLLEGRMFVGIVKDELMVRVGPERSQGTSRQIRPPKSPTYSSPSRRRPKVVTSASWSHSATGERSAVSVGPVGRSMAQSRRTTKSPKT